MNSETKFNALMEKISALRQSGAVDLSTEEDLSLAVMNLISLEEHFFFTAVKTEKPEYFNFLAEARDIRKTLLARLVDRHEGETWCIAKHLLGATMRLMEVGTKLQSDGRRDEAAEAFRQAHRLWTLFWALRLKLVSVASLKQMAGTEQPWTLRDIVNKLVDCCDE